MTKKLVLFISILLLTGCYDYKELNQISIISATSIDKKENLYNVKIQVINPQNIKESTSTNDTSFIIYEGMSNTLQEAYRKITNSSPRLTYSDHMQVLFLSEEIIKEDFSEALDFYMRNPSVRSDFYVLIEKSTNDIIELITPINQISASSIKNTLENNSRNYGTTSLVNFNELSKMYLNPNKEIVLPVIELIGNINEGETTKNTTKTDDYAKYELSNLAIFKDNKFLTYINDEESLGYNFITNNINTAIISYECDTNKNIVTNILNSKTDIKVNKNNIKININTHGNLIETGCDINNIKEIEDNINNKIKNIITNSIYKVQNIYNSDIYGFLDLYYKNDYKYYKKIKDNYYNNIFKNINITVSIKTHISKEGTIMEAYNEKN